MANEVAITRGVSEKPKMGTISKTSSYNLPGYTSTWKFPSWCNDSNRDDRLEWIHCVWEKYFNAYYETDNKSLPGYDSRYNDFARTTHETDPSMRPWFVRKYWVDCQSTVTEDTILIDYTNLYPYGPLDSDNHIQWGQYMKLERMYTRAYGVNGATGGPHGRGPEGTGPMYYFDPPDPPIVGNLEISTDGDNGYKMTSAISAADTNGVRLVMDTSGVNRVGEKVRVCSVWRLYAARSDGDERFIYDHCRAADPEVPTSRSADPNRIITDSSYTVTTHVNGFMGFVRANRKNWVSLQLEVWDQGWNGDSTIKGKTLLLNQAGMVYVTDVKRDNANNPYSNLHISINTSELNDYPCDSMKLLRLKNTTVTTPAEAAELTDTWDVVDSVSLGYYANQNAVTGFVDSYANAKSDRGKRTWYRIETKRSLFDDLSTLGTPFFAESIFEAAPTATDDSVTVVSVSSNDSTSLAVVLGWPNDDSTGTEVSWSEYGDAWQSTATPSTWNVTWKDDTSQVSGYANTAKLILRGLSEGVKYYVKARRYLEEDGSVVDYGPYATASDSQFPTTPVDMPTNVQLHVPSYSVKGQPFEVTWTFDGVSEQTGWILYSVTTENNATVKRVVAQGTDALGSATYTPQESEESVTLSVAVTTGSDYASSDNQTVTFATNPTLALTVPSSLTAQPLSFSVASDSNLTSLTYVVAACGYFFDAPDKYRSQAPGETVYSEKVTPNWEEVSGGSGYSATVSIPNVVNLYDGGSYMVIASLENTSTGLKSEEKQALFKVNWAHKAVHPSDKTRIDSNQSARAITVKPLPPDGAASDDVFDLYRATPDGFYKIAENMMFGTTVTDRFAPFGKNVNMRYRVVTKTSSGDMDWIDIPYNIKGSCIRFDWGMNKRLELPYDIKVKDSYEKDYEGRRHMDGTIAGYWNEGVKRKGTLSTDVVKYGDPEEIELVRNLAQHAGPVFVRMPNGCAFQANVVVNSIPFDYDKLVIAVSFDITEMLLTDVFKPTQTDIELSASS